MADEYLHPIDIRDAHKLTRILTRKVPETRHYDVSFMPFYGFEGRKVKLHVRDVAGAGLASFKADNSNTPVVETSGNLQELFIELVTISEKEVLNESDLIALESADDRIARGAARDILKKGGDLRLRNVNRTRWMAWQAVKDELTIVYPDGASINIDWDLDGDSWNSWFSGSHLPQAGVDWDAQTNDEYSTDIITDVYNWTKRVADDLGCDQSECTLHMNSTTWRYVRRNKYLIRESTPTLPQPRTAPLKQAEVAEVLDVAAVKTVNAYYLEEDESRTKHYMLPDHRILITGPYEWQGKPIAEMYDGLVARVEGERIVVERNPGMRADIYVNKEQVAENIRVTTARMPILNYPAAFLYAQVKTA
jgi:hypothetical protein